MEFEFINTLLRKAGRLAKGVGDDAYVFGDYLISADMSVEGTHFRLDRNTPAQAVEKCLLSNFSDINAMGGMAKAILFSVCINKKWNKKTRDEIADAVAKVCKKHNVKILGGDTVGGSLGTFSVTVFGKASGKILLRSAAKAGDDVWLSGYPGCSCASGYVQVPSPPLKLGPLLAQIKGIGACIDLSDSLSESLQHISVQSKAELQIEEKLIPVFPGVKRDMLLNGGEDFCLLFTARKIARKNILRLAKRFAINKIGTVSVGAAQRGGTIFLDGAKLEAKGWRHF
ncbi:MAG: thiamine-phosphate kinase [Fibromonadales bacterium]|nr:thiamine-phosphate kinase [Fibromonadales bacterium]